MSGTHAIESVHHILLVDGFELPDRLPPAIDDNVAAARRVYPDAQHRSWNGHAIRAFLREHHRPAVLDAFDRLRPYAYKCDLARYCILFTLGGLYLDLSVHCMRPIPVPAEKRIAAFREREFTSPSWVAVNNSFIWAVPGRDEFRMAIDMIVENCRTGFYGDNPLYPTGPVLFGRALVAAMALRGQSQAADDQWIGRFAPFTAESAMMDTAYVTPDRTLVGLYRKREGGDLTHLGLDGTNNYNNFWSKRCVYGEDA